MFGEMKLVVNKEAAPTASVTYNAICIRNDLGDYETLLLTESDLQKFRDRARKNPEDCISLSWFSKAVIFVLKVLWIL
jgi:hypothetical protein